MKNLIKVNLGGVILDLVLKTIRAVSYTLVNPILVLMLLIIALLFYIKNRKTNFIQSMVLGEKLNSPLELTISQIVIGIIAGVIGSLILTLFGVNFEGNQGITLLFVLSLIMIVYKPKIFSLPYIATFLSLISLIVSWFGVGQVIQIKLYIPYIIAIVGVISLIQGLLIIIDGRRGYIPVFTRKNNEILGGFILRRYWSLPIAFFIIFNSLNKINNTNIFNFYGSFIENQIMEITATTILVILPFYSIIGFESITFTKNKLKKTLTLGFTMILYSIILFLLSWISKQGLLYEIISIILMPTIYMIFKYVEKYRENTSKPLFISDKEGICILDVIPNSRAFKCGVRSGDKIIELNGFKPFSEKEILKSISDKYLDTVLKIKNIKGEVNEYIIESKSKSIRFGIILVPVNIRKRYNIDKLLQLSKEKKNV